MLADFQIPTLYNDMKFFAWKNYLRGKILYRSLDPAKNFKNFTKNPNLGEKLIL